MSKEQKPDIKNVSAACANEEIGLKSFFLGPQAENRDWVEYQVHHIFKSWFNWRMKFRPLDGAAISTADQEVPDFKRQQAYTEELLTGLAERFEQEIPKFSPRYIGHMFSEISLPALFGHILTLLHNPNNISAESAPVGVEIENEALEALAKMMGFKAAYGHFTSGGTVANYEMLFRARAKVEQRGHSMESAVLLVPALNITPGLKERMFLVSRTTGPFRWTMMAIWTRRRLQASSTKPMQKIGRSLASSAFLAQLKWAYLIPFTKSKLCSTVKRHSAKPFGTISMRLTVRFLGL